MQLTNKKFIFILTALFLTLLAFLPGMARADNDPEAEPVVSTIADKLIIQLGPEWAGTEFSLITDMGVYPGVIIVNEAGILTTELGGSSTYTLVCLQTPSGQEKAQPIFSEEDTATQLPQQQAEIEIILPTADISEQETAPEQSSQQTTPADQPALTPEPEVHSGIPTLHLVLFVGGVVLCIGGLIVMRLLKRRSEYYDEEDDE